MNRKVLLHTELSRFRKEMRKANSCKDTNVFKSCRDIPNLTQDEISAIAYKQWIADLTLSGIEPNPGPNTRAVRRNRKNKKPKNSRQPYQNNTSNQVAGYTRIPLRTYNLGPPSRVVAFTYIDDTIQRANAGALYLVYSLRINDLYDPDPLILSGSVSGYKESMAFYYYARVLSTLSTLQICNNEIFPVLYGINFTSLSLVGVIANKADALNSLETRFSTGVRLLPAKAGMDKESISVSCNLSQLVGSALQYKTNIDYACQVSSGPAIPLYMNIIVASSGGSAAFYLANGVTTALQVTMNSLLYSPINLRA